MFMISGDDCGRENTALTRNESEAVIKGSTNSVESDSSKSSDSGYIEIVVAEDTIL